MCIYLYIYLYESGPVHLNAREVSWRRVKWTRPSWIGKVLLSVCCLVLPLVLSSVVLSPLVSSCLGFSALVSSCVVCWASPGPFLGLSRASLGTHFGPPKGHFGTPGGPWGFRGLLPLPGCSWAAPWPVLGDPGPLEFSWASPGRASLGPPLGCSRPLWGRPGGSLGLLWGVLRGFWPPNASFHETM